MKCTHCGNIIEQNKSVKIEQNYFCDTLCKYSFYKKEETRQEDSNTNNLHLPEDLKFQIDYPNFLSNIIIVRGSFYGRPKLYLNDKKVKSITRNIFSRKRKYKVENDNGSNVTILLHKRFLDAIPVLEIDSIKIEIRKSLKWYEYTWIAIPVILMFIGGAIGGAIGSIGVFTNSILFRKYTAPFAKYLVTGVNTAVAFLFFFKVFFFIWPAIEELKFNYLQYPKHEISQISEEHNNKLVFLTNSPWLFTEAHNMEGNIVDISNSPMRNSKKYFYKNGNYTQFLADGSYLTGEWKFGKDFETIILIIANETVIVNVTELSNSKFNYIYNNMVVIKHVPYEFDYWGLL